MSTIRAIKRKLLQGAGIGSQDLKAGMDIVKLKINVKKTTKTQKGRQKLWI